MRSRQACKVISGPMPAGSPRVTAMGVTAMDGRVAPARRAEVEERGAIAHLYSILASSRRLRRWRCARMSSCLDCSCAMAWLFNESFAADFSVSRPFDAVLFEKTVDFRVVDGAVADEANGRLTEDFQPLS